MQGSESGITPLHGAAGHGHAETAIALVEIGADVNARSESGITPLHEAAVHGHAETAMALIERGADVNAGDEVGKPRFTRLQSTARPRQPWPD